MALTLALLLLCGPAGCGGGGDEASGSSGAAPGGSVASAPIAEAPIAEEPLVDFQTALAMGSKSRQPIFVHFTADWCQPCKELKRSVYPHPDVAKRLASFVRAEVDIDSAEGKKIARRYTVQTVPVLMILDADGQELRSLRMVGATTPERLATALDRATARTD